MALIRTRCDFNRMALCEIRRTQASAYLNKNLAKSLCREMDLPPRSCDLTPPDYFLRGYVKFLVCTDEPVTIDTLDVVRIIRDIRPAQSLK